MILDNFSYKPFAVKFAVASRAMAVATGFVIPISTNLTNIFLFLVLLFWIASGDYREKYIAIRTNPIALLSLGFFLLFVIGLSYSEVPIMEMEEGLGKYRKWLYVALLMPLFTDVRWQRAGMYAFLAAMFVTLVASYLGAFGVIELYKNIPGGYEVFKSRITQNFLMAFAIYLFAIEAIRNRKLRWVYVSVILLALYNMLFLVYGRTGYLILASLIGLLMYQQFKWRGLGYAILLVLALGTLAYSVSDGLRQRIDEFPSDLQDYMAGRDKKTPVGYRLDFYKNSIILISRHPIFGTGTGSFKSQYRELAIEERTFSSANPHNEYMNIAVQLGLVGLALFLYLLYTQWRLSGKLGPDFSRQAQGLIIAFAVGSLFNSLLLDFTEGHFYVYFTALFYAGIRRSEKNSLA